MRCDACGHEVHVPRSCGSRHCPSCGRHRAEDWIEARKEELLECPYHQLVFTLPPLFYPLVKENPELLYKLLMTSVRKVLDTLSRDPKHLGGIPQFLMALHTWNGALDFHVHVHVLMAAGAYDPATQTWISPKHEGFLFPIGVLSALFRGTFLAGLRKLHDSGRLQMTWPINEETANPAGWSIFLDKAHREPFFTYVEKTAGGPGNLVGYLGHYLHQTGLAESRIVALDLDAVTFLCKDRKKKVSPTGWYPRTMTPAAFVKLYAQHILPKGFHRIRFGGLWSAVTKTRHLADAQAAVKRLGLPCPTVERTSRPEPPVRPPEPCPVCERGTLYLTLTKITRAKEGAFRIIHHARGPPAPAARSLT